MLATIAMTWPLTAGLGRDVPSDLGDPLLNCWILGWVADHLLRLLSGDVRAFAGFWNGNIYYPEPLALAYSEHLVAQAVQALPVYALTGNLILSYNVVFLFTFVLSALGVYLLVRELTGSSRAAFVAGLIYAFVPYRIGQSSHIQVMSSQWMPFAIFGLRRYFETRRVIPLAGAAVALIAQNLSCGYFLLYFSPIVALYVLYEIVDRGLSRDARVWSAMIVTGAIVTAATWPFLQPYRELRAAGFPPRPIEEVRAFSADVYSYLTTHELERTWGWLRAYPKPEGDLFPGAVPVVFAVVGVVAHVRRTWPGAALRALPLQRRRIARIAIAIAALHGALVVLIVLTGGVITSLGPIPLRVSNLHRVLRNGILALTVAAVAAAPIRQWLRGVPRGLFAFVVVGGVLTWWLSLGPSPQSLGRPLSSPGPYAFLYWFVPGFDGLRVPARYGMIVMLFLALLAGLGAAEIDRRWRRGRRVVIVAGLVFLIEAAWAPIHMNGVWQDEGVVMPPPRIETGDEIPPVYRFARTLPSDAVLAEFPFGVYQYEMRYMYYSTQHWRRLLNGYSGGFPEGYKRTSAALGRVLIDRNQAWQTLSQSGTTHAIVHEATYAFGEGEKVSSWLQQHGALLIDTFGTDKVFAIPRARSKPPNLRN